MRRLFCWQAVSKMTARRFWCGAGILLLAACTVLGQERGIDHIGIAVRDLEMAKRGYRDRLGFTLAPGGKHPHGTANATIAFADRTYLELLTFYDRTQASWLVDFLEKQEGACLLGLATSSADQTAAFLRSRGFEIDGPTGGTITMEGAQDTPPELWRAVRFKPALLPDTTVFFIEYNRKAWEELQRKSPGVAPAGATRHANTAKRVASVWVVVKDLAAATKVYESVGLRAGRKLELAQLGADGREMEAGRGVILLLQSKDPGGPVAAFLAKRGEALMGVSIEVGQLETARKVLETNTKEHFTLYAGPYGQSLLITGEVTRGAWMEMFQK